MKTSRENFPSKRSGRRPRLFISYRRRFDHGSARLLKERLTQAFGEGAVFRDVDDIAPGDDFPESIREAVETCDAFLPLISPGWLGVIGDLRDPADFVRREIAAALARRVALIPVLLGGARMPEPDELPEELRELASRQAVELSDTRWDYDVQRLIEVIRPLAAPEEDSSHTFTDKPASGFRFFGTRLGKAALALLVAASLAAAAYVYYPRDGAPPPREVDYAECLGLVSVFRPHEARVEADAGVLPLVAVDEYELATGAPPTGLPLLVRLSDSGREVGAVSLRYFRGQSANDWKFVVELAVEPPCVRVENFSNASKPAYARTLTDWDTLRVHLRGREYLLRVGDHGDSLTATLTRGPR
ncbi:MAG: toll/interleukin-1 receptor domain-containing protein [Acidobacteria bacterium]|nr:toll/interleukin-1 receptor domain-containing protein [Acidobacteriota bacterium]